jgi:hypothetical protein
VLVDRVFDDKRVKLLRSVNSYVLVNGILHNKRIKLLSSINAHMFVDRSHHL